MATRKQLSDVLREEAKKVPDTQAALEDSGQPGQAAAPNAPATQATTQPKKTKTAPATAAVKLPAVDAVQPDAAIGTLKAALNDANVNEGVLQRKIDALEVDLAEQRALVQQLKTELEQTKHAKTELDEAKRVILQLSELNSKLEAAKSLKPAQAAPQAIVTPASPQATTSTAKPEPQTSAAKTVHPGHATSQRSQIELHRMFDHPNLPTPASTSLSNEEIGWVD